jgi:hypothetical protein
MTYEECLRETFFNHQSWLIVAVGLAFALVLRKFSMPRIAAGVAVVAILCGASLSYVFYDVACVELYEG